MSSVHRDKEFLCIAPTVEIMATREGQSRLFNSHDWEVDRVEGQGMDQIFSKVHCSICGLERVFIISNIEESTQTASRIRELNKKRQNEERVSTSAPTN